MPQRLFGPQDATRSLAVTKYLGKLAPDLSRNGERRLRWSRSGIVAEQKQFVSGGNVAQTFGQLPAIDLPSGQVLQLGADKLFEIFLPHESSHANARYLSGSLSYLGTTRLCRRSQVMACARAVRSANAIHGHGQGRCAAPRPRVNGRMRLGIPWRPRRLPNLPEHRQTGDKWSDENCTRCPRAVSGLPATRVLVAIRFWS